jgi:hypothetical protein
MAYLDELGAWGKMEQAFPQNTLRKLLAFSYKTAISL